MEIHKINTELDYQRALARLEKIFDAKTGTEEGKEADLLAVLVDEYEKVNYPIS